MNWRGVPNSLREAWTGQKSDWQQLAEYMVDQFLADFTTDKSLYRMCRPSSNGETIDEIEGIARIALVMAWSWGGADNATRARRRCGTSHIVPLSAYRIPEQLALDAPYDEVCSAFGGEAIEALGKHRMLRELMAGRGFELQALPFYGAVYTVETFANVSGTRMTWLSRPLGKQLAEEFGVNSSVSRLRSWIYCIDPMPIVRGVRIRLLDSKRPLWERLFTRRIGFRAPTQ